MKPVHGIKVIVSKGQGLKAVGKGSDKEEIYMSVDKLYTVDVAVSFWVVPGD